MSKGETFLIRRTADEKPAELIRIPDEVLVLASASNRRSAEDVAVKGTLRDVLFVLFRHLKKCLAFFVAVFGLAAAAAVLMPSSYRSSASLLVRLGPESMLPDPSVQIGKAFVAPIQSRASEINTELQILRSRELAEAVISRLGPARLLSGAPAAPLANPDRDAPAFRSAVLAVDRGLEVSVEPDSAVLNVGFEAKDPAVARDVVAAYTEEFRDLRARIYRDPQTAAFFGNRQESVRKEIDELERSIAALKDSTGVPDLEGQRQVLMERSARIQNDIDEMQRALEASRAMPNHPNWERLRTLERLRDDAALQLARLNEAAGRLQALERDYGIKTETFKQYAAIAEQAAIDRDRSANKLSNISIVQAASTPVAPSKPNRKLLLGVGLFLALSGAIGLAFVAEATDHTVKRPEDLQALGLSRSVSIPRIGMLGHPALPAGPPAASVSSNGAGEDERGGTFAAGPWATRDVTEPAAAGLPARQSTDRAGPLAAPVNWAYDLRQGVRRLAEKLLEGTGPEGASPRVIAFVSTRAGEGATTVASATAALLAERIVLDAPQHRAPGDVVLLIDADLHAPDLHRQFGVGLSPGLTDWLADPSAAEAAIRHGPVEGLQIMPAGGLRGGTLTPNRLRRLIDVLAPNYRYLVIDLPPLEHAPEAARLAAQCDGVVVVMETERLRKQVAAQTLATLTESGAYVLGAVLNKRRFHVPGWLYERV